MGPEPCIAYLREKAEREQAEKVGTKLGRPVSQMMRDLFPEDREHDEEVVAGVPML